MRLCAARARYWKRTAPGLLPRLIPWRRGDAKPGRSDPSSHGLNTDAEPDLSAGAARHGARDIWARRTATNANWQFSWPPGLIREPASYARRHRIRVR